MKSHILISIFLCTYGFFEETQQDNTHYVATVVEFAPNLSESGEESTRANTKSYQDIITSDEVSSSDIIVFPESCLNGVHDEPKTFVPHPESVENNPCDSPDNYEFFLKQISCTARTSRKYVVINLTEKEICTDETQKKKGDPRPCSLNGETWYNTNVVFDRNGTIIARYRKTNRFAEPTINITYIPEHVTFTTDFGVTFGTFICFDMMNDVPVINLVKRGVKHFVYPTMWFSEIPYFSTVQTQFAWAYGNDVTLLAAGFSHTSTGTTGTGIYMGRKGTLHSFMADISTTKIFTARVPKNKDDESIVIEKPTNPIESMRNITVKSDEIRKYETKEVNSSDSSLQSFSLCQNSHCCEFSIQKSLTNRTRTESAYNYRVGAFSNSREFDGNGRAYIKSCGLFACLNSDVDSCAKLYRPEDFPVSDTFEYIKIKTRFIDENGVYFQPNSIYRNLIPVPVDEFQMDVVHNGLYADVTLTTNSQTDLLTFGIVANYYNTSS